MVEIAGASAEANKGRATHDGAICLFLDRLSSRHDVQATLFHELLHERVRLGEGFRKAAHVLSKLQFTHDAAGCRLSLPQAFPPGCIFAESPSHDQYVQYPDGKVFQVNMRGVELIEVHAMPANSATIAEARFLDRVRARQEFAKALDDLGRFLETHSASQLELDAQLEKAVGLVGTHHALAVVPVGLALEELGFQTQEPDTEALHWHSKTGGVELQVAAYPEMFGQWRIVGIRVGGREAMFDERVLAAELPRGKAAEVVLSMWRNAFGKTLRPPGALDLGRLYEQHREILAQIDLHLPRVHLDGQMLRANRRWIAERHGHEADAWLSVAFADGLLRLSIVGSIYAVPGQGTLGDAFELSLVDFMAIPPTCLRGSRITLERTVASLSVRWYSMAIKTVD